MVRGVSLSISLTVNVVDPERLKHAVMQALLERSAGPWQVWLMPHDTQSSHWRLRISCPGYVSAVSLAPEEQTTEGVLRRLKQLLDSPVNCIDQTA